MTAAVPLPAMIGGKYRPLRLIARGGMGAVFEVIHENTGEHLALKLMSARSLLAPDLVARFRREARIQSSVKSEHVVRVVDADVAAEIDGAPFIVMELLQGQDFERICAERQPTRAETIEWLTQAAQALDKAHNAGIVHRDLKPENLFLATRDDLPATVKILDFGIAKLTTDGDQGATQTGQILGTVRYMAPEQAAGAKGVSPAADRFALGLIAFRLLCGRHYFEGDNWVTLLQTVTRGPAARPSELGCDHGRAFDAWFARACALDPMQRFATCVEQVVALSDALARGAVEPRRRPWRGPAPWVATAVACAALFVIWIGVRQRAKNVEPLVSAPQVAAPVANTGPAAHAVVPPAVPAAPAPSTAPAPLPSSPVASPARPISRRVARVASSVKASANDPGEPPPESGKPPPRRDPIWEEP